MDEFFAIILRIILIGIIFSVAAACLNWKYTKIPVYATVVLMWFYIVFGGGNLWRIQVSQFDVGQTGMGNVLVSIGELLLAIAGSFFFPALCEILLNRRREEEKNRELSQKIEAGKEQADILVKSYQEQRRMTHDFRNHLYTIDSLLKSRDYGEAELYVGELLESAKKMRQVVHTGHPVIDAILTRAYGASKEKQILMEFELNNLEAVTVPKEELLVLLSNLLDNAVEAAGEVTGKRRIIVKIRQSETGLLLSVSNTTNHADFTEPAGILTTKKEKLQHGYGLGNVRRILEKNHGEYVAECRDGWFRFTAVIR